MARRHLRSLLLCLSVAVLCAPLTAGQRCEGKQCPAAPQELAADDVTRLLETVLRAQPPSPLLLGTDGQYPRDKRVRTHAAGFARAWMNRMRSRERRPFLRLSSRPLWSRPSQ
ncbi:uncharacterized protein LOC119111844 [Pollicipes pollicipes]|uniref:uncharacterized protein LOC119111844 n=1 Tax=Pollicipes pollicipes TaxID=41117 RepID=UPI001884DEE0|nr:uncharacterized protein LOC119111844 [Pollicipes pollicipes]